MHHQKIQMLKTSQVILDAGQEKPKDSNTASWQPQTSRIYLGESYQPQCHPVTFAVDYQ